MEALIKVIDSILTEEVTKVVAPALAPDVAKLVGSEEFTEAIEKQAKLALNTWARRTINIAPSTRYANAFEFVDEYLSVMFPRTPEARWSDKWWSHPAVYRRIVLLWGTFEAKVAANPATGEEEWLRTIAHFHMNWIMDRGNGPMSACSFNDNKILDPLPTSPLTDDDRTGLGE